MAKIARLTTEKEAQAKQKHQENPQTKTTNPNQQTKQNPKSQRFWCSHDVTCGAGSVLKKMASSGLRGGGSLWAFSSGPPGRKVTSGGESVL